MYLFQASQIKRNIVSIQITNNIIHHKDLEIFNQLKILYFAENLKYSSY